VAVSPYEDAGLPDDDYGGRADAEQEHETGGDRGDRGGLVGVLVEMGDGVRDGYRVVIDQALQCVGIG